jgi:hypothetical protein
MRMSVPEFNAMLKAEFQRNAQLVLATGFRAE